MVVEETVTSESVKGFTHRLVGALVSKELDKIRHNPDARQRVDKRGILRDHGITLRAEFAGVVFFLIWQTATDWKIRNQDWLFSSTNTGEMVVMGDMDAYLRDMTMLMLAVDLDDL